MARKHVHSLARLARGQQRDAVLATPGLRYRDRDDPLDVVPRELVCNVGGKLHYTILVIAISERFTAVALEPDVVFRTSTE